MESLVFAIAPVFVAGFAVQQLLELISPIIERISSNKKPILNLFSLFFGLTLAGWGGFSVLLPLGFSSAPDLIDVIVTGLVVSAGTEGINSILKFLGYTKEKKKAEAADQQSDLNDQASEIMVKM